MTEKRFEPDCNDCHANQYNYSLLNSRYEADIERDEIINWNKDADNVTLRGLEMIVEELNFKEMQLEHCRKGYEKLIGENEQLKQELYDCKDARKAYKQDWKACVSYCDEYKDEINILKDNIEGLKEENERLKNWNKCLAEKRHNDGVTE